MSGPDRAVAKRVVTPAVTIAALFALVAAIVSAAFVTARGGLQLPVAPSSGPGVALASPTAAAPSPEPSAEPTAVPASTPVASAAATAPAPSPSAEPTPAPSPTPVQNPTGPPDPLAALPGCPGFPGCYEYTVRRFDSYTAINDRYGLLLWITNALNPEIGDKGIIVTGQVVYLGRDPEARLEPCANGASCRQYVVRSGDSLSVVAARFGVTVTGIRTLNPQLATSGLVAGQTILLPLYQG